MGELYSGYYYNLQHITIATQFTQVNSRGVRYLPPCRDLGHHEGCCWLTWVPKRCYCAEYVLQITHLLKTGNPNGMTLTMGGTKPSAPEHGCPVQSGH